MAYSNVTPPTLPSYDSVANPYYLIQFEYALGAEDWSTVRFWYGAAPLTWNGSTVTNSADCYLYTWGTGSPEWTAWGFMAEAGEMALTPGPTTADTYMRLYTNHDILDANGKVWLAEGTVTPTEADKEAESQIRIKSKLAGIIAAWCAPVRQFPKPTAEPVAFLYGPDKIRLPKVPVVEGCPHEYVFTTLGGYQVILTPVPLVRLSNGAFSAPQEVGTVTAIQYDYFEGNPDWGYRDEYELSYDNYRLYNTLKWSNTNVYNEDTTLYLPKSKPEPVYE
jgi:hypothetical protein